MSNPKRIQMTRNKPWRADNPDAVIVDRRTRYGNHAATIRRAKPADRTALIDARWVVEGRNFTGLYVDRNEAAADAVMLFREATDDVARHLSDEAFEKELAPLRGRDLACWCPLDAPCHADVLLELANAPRPAGGEEKQA